VKLPLGVVCTLANRGANFDGSIVCGLNNQPNVVGDCTDVSGNVHGFYASQGAG
jgi:hypothetical protein